VSHTTRVVLWLDQLLKRLAEVFVIQRFGNSRGAMQITAGLGAFVLFQRGADTAAFTHALRIDSRAIANAISLEKSSTCA
jgi:hypothetical protein